MRGQGVAVPSAAHVPDPTRVGAAIAVAASVERASHRLPGAIKCFPRAVATQWLLRAGGLAGTLVIAIHRDYRTGPDAFHAWVEAGGETIIGHCDRNRYVPLLSFSQGHG